MYRQAMRACWAGIYRYTFNPSRFVTAAVKFQFCGESPRTMRYELHRSNNILRAPRPVACARSAYTIHQITVCRSVMHRTPKAPSDEGSKATSNETIARGNRTYDYVSAKLTGGEKITKTL